MKKLKNYLKRHEALEFFLKVMYFKYTSVLAKFIPDLLYLKLQYRFRTGKGLNINRPTLYNEKLQWFKLNYQNPLMKQCVDKWNVRKYVEDKGLSELLIPAYGPYDSVAEIDQNMLPASFIMKLTNGSGFNIICNDKKSFDFNLAGKRFKKWVNIDFFSSRREWAYKDVPNKIMCENLLLSADGKIPSDIRFFCFNGEPKVISVDLDSVSDGVKTCNYLRHLFSPDWEVIEGKIQYEKKENFEPERPENLEEMLDIVRTLAADFPAVRVDLYNLDGQIYFGELTFYHASGYQNIEPEAFHKQLGDYFDIDNL